MKREMNEMQQMERGLLTERREVLWRPFMQAVRRYELIQKGDAIAVCISGGKDSMLLAVMMKLLARHSEIPFSAHYLIMDPGYSPLVRAQILENARRLEIPYTLYESDVFEAAASQQANACFMCARMRRGCLYGKARELGCNKIALGHHYDDVIETTLMAMLHGGQIQAMPPKLRAKNHPGMELIRPLYRVRERDIIAWRDAFGLSFIQCACRVTRRPAQDSARARVKALLSDLERDDPKVCQNVFNSIHRVQLDTLPGWKYRSAYHSFLDDYDEAGTQTDHESDD